MHYRDVNNSISPCLARIVYKFKIQSSDIQQEFGEQKGLYGELKTFLVLMWIVMTKYTN